MSNQTSADLRARVIPRIRPAIVAVALACALVAPSLASAATAPPFVAELVISDDVFRASSSLSAADIQAFLEKYPGVLDTTLAPRHADGVMTPVSQLIWEVSQEFTVNPKVLLVMLQKEQGLLTKTAPSQTTLDWALGFGCYDGSTPETRDPAYAGLGNQIWYAARALDVYGQTTWTPGMKRTICINCVTTPYTANTEFVPQNLATYKLYVYTPHSHGPTPDIYGGNYLFWTVYWKYFDEGPLANPAVRPVYRFYNKKNGSHFYTAAEAERYTVIRLWPDTYTYEGPAYWVNTANPSNVVPLHRFYNKKNGSHFYTASEDEKNNVIAKFGATYNYEGPVYNVSMTPEGGSPMYRFYNKKNGSHFYTTSATEADTVIANYAATYTYEGVAYYIGN
ncbi:MAG: hypothetical protein EG823_06640 [Actinobacteria bacterium]|nr:hypothetical protein [Actinomycetota bacterium]